MKLLSLLFIISNISFAQVVGGGGGSGPRSNDDLLSQVDVRIAELKKKSVLNLSVTTASIASPERRNREDICKKSLLETLEAEQKVLRANQVGKKGMYKDLDTFLNRHVMHITDFAFKKSQQFNQFLKDCSGENNVFSKDSDVNNMLIDQRNLYILNNKIINYTSECREIITMTSRDHDIMSLLKSITKIGREKNQFSP